MASDHHHRGYAFKFTSYNKLERFIRMYEDLFVPYSEVYWNNNYFIKEIKYFPDLKVKGMYRWPHRGLFYANLYPKNLKIIVEGLGLEKTRFGSGVLGYVI